MKDNIKEIKDTKEEKSSSGRNKRFKIGSVLAAIFLLIYIPSLLNWLSDDNISSDIVRIGAIEESINVDGILVRDEILLNPSEKTGRFIPVAMEGERVPAYSNVASVSDKSSVGLIGQLDEINSEIVKAQIDNAKKTEFFSEDIAKLDDAIGQKVQQMMLICNNGAVLKLGQLHGDIDGLIEKKAEIAGGSEEDSTISRLKEKRRNIEEQINSNTSMIRSEYSGIVSYNIDGYENILNPKSLKKIDISLFGKLPELNNEKILEYDNIQAGKPFAKIIRGSSTWITIVLEKHQTELFKKNDIVKEVRINDIGESCQGIVDDVNIVDNRQVLVIRIDRFSEMLTGLRKINADLVKKYYPGLKVPVKSLYSVDVHGKQAKIMLIKANTAVEVLVDIVGKDETYAIVKTPDNEVKKTISLYDTYIINPENVKEGQIILK